MRIVNIQWRLDSPAPLLLSWKTVQPTVRLGILGLALWTASAAATAAIATPLLCSTAWPHCPLLSLPLRPLPLSLSPASAHHHNNNDILPLSHYINHIRAGPQRIIPNVVPSRYPPDEWQPRVSPSTSSSSETTTTTKTTITAIATTRAQSGDFHTHIHPPTGRGFPWQVAMRDAEQCGWHNCHNTIQGRWLSLGGERRMERVRRHEMRWARDKELLGFVWRLSELLLWMSDGQCKNLTIQRDSTSYSSWNTCKVSIVHCLLPSSTWKRCRGWSVGCGEARERLRNCSRNGSIEMMYMNWTVQGHVECVSGPPT